MGADPVNRDSALAALDGAYDVLIIGGGATGLGAAVEAATRGYSTALVESSDFAKATSSRSTKLVHGGVRYLQNGDVPLVREALRERARLRANAPHLVKELGFILPVYRWFDGPYYFAGLKAYDLLAGSSKFAPSRYVGRRKTLERLPALRRSGLHGSISYYDGQFDDARLAIALARTATDRGASVVNYVRALRFTYHKDRIAGAIVRDEETSREYEVRARVVVNATGIFADDVRRLDDRTSLPLLEHSRGSHLIFSRETFPGRDALIIPKTDDGRVLFAIPWHEHVVVGTTEIKVGGALLDPAPVRSEIDYIVAHFNRYLEHPVSRTDALAAFAGLRPLVNKKNVGSTAKLSREHIVDVSASGLVTIAGGKWTTYRKMAQDTIDTAVREARLPASTSSSAHLGLHGSTMQGSPSDDDYAAYGTDCAALRALEAQDPALHERLDPRLPYTCAEVVFAVREEMARTVDDVLSRRTRASFLDASAAAAAAPLVAAMLAAELGRDDRWRNDQSESFRSLLASNVASYYDAVETTAAQAS